MDIGTTPRRVEQLDLARSTDLGAPGASQAITKVIDCYTEGGRVFDARTDKWLCMAPKGTGDTCQLHLIVSQTVHEGDRDTPDDVRTRLRSALLFDGDRCIELFDDTTTQRVEHEYQITIQEAFV